MDEGNQSIVMDDEHVDLHTLHRIRDTNRALNRRKSRPSDSIEETKIRNERKKTKPSHFGTLKFYVDSEEEKIAIFNKLDAVKLTMAEKISQTSNAHVLTEVLDFYLKNHGEGLLSMNDDAEVKENPPVYQFVDKDKTDEDFFLLSPTSLQNLCDRIHVHSEQNDCDGKLMITDIQRFSHVGKFVLTCGKHELRWDTSGHVEGGLFLANVRVLHAYLASGLRYVQYDRFCSHANIGVCSDTMQNALYDRHYDVTEHLTQKYCQDAVDEAVGIAVLKANSDQDVYHGIDIMTDARHAWRKNAAQSDVIALSCDTKKCIQAVVVTREDESISQRHEMFGIKKIYENLTSKNINVRIHSHDRNVSVNKYLREHQTEVSNANDTWHATKGINRELKKVCGGTRSSHGKTWHEELSDKAASIKTHCYWVMKTCEGSANNLVAGLDNIVDHYKNDHTRCSPESRCKIDPNYEPTKTIIESPAAECILREAIRKLPIYRNPIDYVHCMDTHYVETFNNSALIYHDKRIVFKPREYRRRTFLSVLDWNENIEREFTSIHFTEDPTHPRRRQGKKLLKPKTYRFVKKLWEGFISSFYQP